MKKVKKKNIVNLTGGVETDDGRTLYGMDAEQYLKMKAKEDPRWERKVGQWIEDVIQESINTSDLWSALKDGLVLIKLVNTIKPGTITKWNNKDKLHPLMERENINLYLEACWKIGVGSTEMFITSDLHSKKGMSAVLNNIAALSREAQKWGNVSVAPIGPAQVQKSSGAPKWEVNVRGPVFVGEIESDEDDPEEQVIKLKNQLRDAQTEVSKLTVDNESLIDEVSELRSQLRDSSVGNKNFSGKSNESVTALNREISELKKLLREAENKGSSLERDISRLQQSLDRNEKEKRDLSSRIRQLEADNRNLKKNVNLKSKKNFSSQHQELIDALQAEIAELNEENNLLNDEANSLYEENNRLLDEVDKYANKGLSHTNLEEENRTLRRALERYKKQQSNNSNNTTLNSSTKEKKLNRHVSIADMTNNRIEGGDDTYFNLLKRLQVLIRKALDVDSLVDMIDEDIQELKDIFQKDSGRRIFANELHNVVGEKELKIDESSFEFVLFLVMCCLNEMNLQNGADFITAKLILDSSTMISRKVISKKERIIDAVRIHPIWQNLGFWTEYFWDKASQKYSALVTADGQKKKAVGFLKKHISRYTVEMWEMGNVNPDIISDFASEVIYGIEDLNIDKKNKLMQKTSELINKLSEGTETPA
eukprot:TRINITY_DN13316_c0_g1_i1.p1 TRINITY_DN13316_c0_g1~~TRINITY_DN13316_c0_g1_i1.p1  ORF type:complete len:652 (+),score=169.69 TRINITY_DN13316_c0_g1_i1:43-1998(+)